MKKMKVLFSLAFFSWFPFYNQISLNGNICSLIDNDLYLALLLVWRNGNFFFRIDIPMAKEKSSEMRSRILIPIARDRSKRDRRWAKIWQLIKRWPIYSIDWSSFFSVCFYLFRLTSEINTVSLMISTIMMDMKIKHPSLLNIEHKMGVVQKRFKIFLFSDLDLINSKLFFSYR